MRVALGMVGVYTRGVDLKRDLVVLWCVGVMVERTGDGVEAAVQPTVAEVLDAELDKGVRGIDLILRRL